MTAIRGSKAALSSVISWHGNLFSSKDLFCDLVSHSVWMHHLRVLQILAKQSMVLFSPPYFILPPLDKSLLHWKAKLSQTVYLFFFFFLEKKELFTWCKTSDKQCVFVLLNCNQLCQKTPFINYPIIMLRLSPKTNPNWLGQSPAFLDKGDNFVYSPVHSFQQVLACGIIEVSIH